MLSRRPDHVPAKGKFGAVCLARVEAASVDTAPPNVPQWCANQPYGQWWGYRFEQCLIDYQDWTYYEYINGQPQWRGSAKIQVGHYQAGMGGISGARTWYDDLDIAVVGTSGYWPNATADVAPKCIGNLCVVKSEHGDVAAPVTLRFGDPVQGKAVFTNSGSSTVDLLYTSFTLTLTPQVTGPVPGSSTWSSSDLRCDSTWGNRTNACAIPWYEPTMDRYSLSSTNHGQVAQHISNSMNSTANHWGWEGIGLPLSMTRDEALKRANNTAACGRVLTPPLHSCDEYPFASTYQGASRNKDYTTAIVLATQNSSAGSTLGNWYADMRMIEGDEFWMYIRS